MAARPLAGMRVIELSSHVASPLGGMTLAQLGAEVIRVDPLGGVTDRQRWPLAPNGESLYWAGLNQGKRSVTVDLRSAEGAVLVADLVEASGAEGGIVLTNARPRPGLSPADLRRRRPDLIHVQLSGTRDGGIAVDYTVNAATGFPELTGCENQTRPVNHVLPAWDVATGLYLAVGLLAAERQRRRKEFLRRGAAAAARRPPRRPIPAGCGMTRVLGSDAEALDVARDLAASFAPGAAKRDAERILPHAEVQALSEAGLFSLTVPREHGGPGVSARTLGEVFAELAAGDGSIGQIPQNHYFFLRILHEADSPGQQEFFYREVLAGRRFGNALSERNSRDAHDFRITFRREGGEYFLDGTKYYSTGSLFAHWIPVYAKDPAGLLHAVWVPAGHPGVRVADDWNGMGQRTTGSGTVRFSDVRVPPEYVVPAHRIFERTEIFGAFGNYLHAAIDAGIAVAALRDGRAAIRDLARPWWEAGVERAADEPAVIDRFGELALRVRAARALVREAGEALEAADEHLTEHTSAEASAAVAAARAAADEAAVGVSSEIFALVGARAASDELNLHRHWRNARTHTVHDPRRWKIRHLGQWELNDVAPPRNGIV